MNIVCPDCHGRDFDKWPPLCSTCNGHGEIPEPQPPQPTATDEILRRLGAIERKLGIPDGSP